MQRDADEAERASILWYVQRRRSTCEMAKSGSDNLVNSDTTLGSDGPLDA